MELRLEHIFHLRPDEQQLRRWQRLQSPIGKRRGEGIGDHGRSFVRDGVEKAIRESSLGLNPVVEGQLMRIPIPELNAERRQELVKVAHKYAEQARVAVRHVRRDGMEDLKKAEKDGMSKDEVRSQSDRVQKLTDDKVAEIDATVASKEQEISQI